MSLGVAVLINLLLFVDKADSKKGESLFVILMEQNVKCGGILSAPTGNISSPNFPGLYPYNIDCSWLIVVAEGSSVLLTFHHFELEYHANCAYDYIKIYNGISEDEGNLLGTFCGDISPPRFTSSWNVMSIIFHSDRHVAHRGFSVGYRKGNSLYLIQNDRDQILSSDEMKIEHFCSHGTKSRLTYQINCTLTGECQQVLSAVSGNFSSPHFPNIYPNNINCHWSIALAAGYRIKLFFPVMDLEDRNSLSDECDYDSIAVYDGDSQTDTLLGRWCGRESVYYQMAIATLLRASTNTVISASLQKHRNITMLVNKLYIDFSDGKQQNVQEYKVQCDALRKIASVSIISAEERRLEEQAQQTDNDSNGNVGEEEAEPHDLSDIVFISICVLAVILMVIAIVWLVLL
uniref:CUB domain-containing protein n=1 Tax=Anabas testudineus TaxID=64144 RepID=A0A3Q1K9Y6_ANATE